jgi:CDP-glucose 4,6-dehydratase
MENLVTLPELQGYYRDKKVFVTGHTGFKGAWLVACLHWAGARVKGYALAPEYPNGLFDVLGPLPGVESCIADIRDRDRLRVELLDFQPDYVFHLAAQPLVRRSYEIPAETFDVNVTGTANLLEAVTRMDRDCAVVVITTDKVYENKETGILYKESDVLGGHDPYSASKACAELVVASFRHSFFAPVGREEGAGVGASGGTGEEKSGKVRRKAIASVRAGNVIGGGDWSRDRIIPDIIRSLTAGKPIEVRNPSSVRPWQHVLEPVAGYLRLGGLLRQDPRRYGRAYNFGPLPEDHLEVRQLVDTAIAIWGEGSWKDGSIPGAPHEAALLKLDITQARRDLNWSPRLDAQGAIRWSLEWYRQGPDRQAEYTFEQIKSYFA